MNSEFFPCPCCNSPSLGSYGDYEICDICGWEDDPVQSAHPALAGGANEMSLDEAKARREKKRVNIGNGVSARGKR